MAKFPIRYTDATPSGRSTGVNANIDVRTGQEFIGDAVSNLGNVTYGIGKDIQVAQDSMELSTLDRKTKEIWNAASKTMETTTDDDARKKVYDKALADVNGLQGKNARTNEAFTKMRNDYMPAFESQFNDLDRTMRIKSAKDEMEFNGKAALESGDIDTYNKIAVTGLNTGLIGKAEFDRRVTEAPANAQLLQSERALLSGNAMVAYQNLEKMDVSKLTNDQLDSRAKIMDAAARQSKQNSDAAEVQVLFDLNANKDRSPAEKMVLGKQYIEQLKTSGISPERAGAMIDRIEQWQKGAKIQTDRMFKSQTRTDILKAIANGESTDAIKSRIIENSSKLDDTDFDELMKLADDPLTNKGISPIAGRTLILLDSAFEGTYGDKELLPEFQQSMLNWITLPENKNKTPAEIWRHGKETMALWESGGFDVTAIKKEVLTNDVPTIQSEEEYAKLASGATYRSPDGKIRTKK
jgi:hypothetical protein